MEDEDSGILDTIRELMHQQPFDAFRVVTAGGEKYLVESPDNLAIGKSQLCYFHPRSDKFVFIRINQLVAVERFEERPAA